MTDRELKTGWDEFLYWAAKFVSQPSFEEDERTYKIRAVEPFTEAMFRLSDGTWDEPLRRGFQNKDNNIVDWRAAQRFLDWAKIDRSSAAEALAVLWSEDAADGSERVDAFNELLPAEVLSRPGVLCNLAAYLLGAKDPIRWPNFRVTVLDLAYELARYPAVPKKSSPGEHYGHALSFFDAMIEEASTRGVPVHDRLDAQGVMWVIAGGGERGPYDLSHEEWGELDAFVKVPSTIRKEQTKKARTPPKQNKRPTITICPLCVNDDEVRLLGPDGDRWLFECEGGVGHPDPYQFSSS